MVPLCSLLPDRPTRCRVPPRFTLPQATATLLWRTWRTTYRSRVRLSCLELFGALNWAPRRAFSVASCDALNALPPAASSRLRSSRACAPPCPPLPWVQASKLPVAGQLATAGGRRCAARHAAALHASLAKHCFPSLLPSLFSVRAAAALSLPPPSFLSERPCRQCKGTRMNAARGQCTIHSSSSTGRLSATRVPAHAPVSPPSRPASASAAPSSAFSLLLTHPALRSEQEAGEQGTSTGRAQPSPPPLAVTPKRSANRWQAARPCRQAMASPAS